jgi:hypothetical protein
MALFCMSRAMPAAPSWVEDRDMGDVRARLEGVIITFPDPASRPSRSALRAGEPRGEILLFTGVRYERLDPNPGPSRPLASDGRGRRRRS